MGMQINGYLEAIDLKGDKVIRCKKCGYEICELTKNYKEHVLHQYSRVTVVPRVGDPAVYKLEQELELRRYYCPGCAVQLECEISLPGLAPLWDVQIEA